MSLYIMLRPDDPARFTSVCSRLEKSRDARDILALGENHDLDIVYTKDLPLLIPGRFTEAKNGRPAKITLNAHHDEDTQVGSLAHELRHWQQSLKTKMLLHRPLYALSLMRLLEGDAHVSTLKILSDLKIAGDPRPLEAELQHHPVRVALFASPLANPHARASARQRALRDLFAEAQEDMNPYDDMVMLHASRLFLSHDGKSLRAVFRDSARQGAPVSVLKKQLSLQIDGKPCFYLQTAEQTPALLRSVQPETLTRALRLQSDIRAKIRSSLQPI